MKKATRRHTVIPAKAGIQSPDSVDTSLLQSVGETPFSSPYEVRNLESLPSNYVTALRP